ncbi:ABC transporter substrate-binding protein [Youngiibacter multivorans]|uniref:NitT/TauT family transport system substrate-binding protein n=1 Tax=Youngiibacter multivorans TaxID=937251 RepID=A0ABS4G048_9CLOT|nr:ABC transporter substrate-binding protein [Youngiibacter multivorans]MBP1917920.1 NitT/TauT family transport system substrate-binding protein [Youngiibacter multivorans]
MITIIVIGLVFSILLSGCGKKEEKTLSIGEQFGLAYAPLEIMKSKGFLEAALQERNLDIAVQWKKLGNTSAIRESMLSGDLDIGFTAIPPFLIGRDKGMDWRIIAGISKTSVSLVTKDPDLSSISDLKDNHRIMLPQPGSIQHILLMMAAEKATGKASAFDGQLLSMAHPDGVTAFISGNEDLLHFTTPPYLQEELENGGRVLLDGRESFGGDFTFIVGICQDRVFKDTKVYESFKEALVKTMEYIESDKDGTLRILSEAYEYETGELESYLGDGTTTFGTGVEGIDTFVEFMERNGLISSSLKGMELFWEQDAK